MSENKEKQIKVFNNHQIPAISKPLSEMEVVDLMIYGDDVLFYNQDNTDILSDK